MTTNLNEIEAAVDHGRRCLNTIGETKNVQIRRTHLETLISAASARGVADGGECILCKTEGPASHRYCLYEPAPSSPAGAPETEAIARIIWHRWGDNAVLEWEDANRSEYLLAADDILALFRTPPAPAGDIDAVTGCADDQGLFAQPDMDEPASAGEECENCQGASEIFGHADDCDNDDCALALGIYDCAGKVEPCPRCDPFTTGFIAGRDAAADKADEHVAKAREAIANCKNWSAVQGEWSRARDTALDIGDAIRALKAPGDEK